MLSRVNVATAVNILSSTSTSFGGAQQIDEKLQQQLLEEEEQAMNQFKVNKQLNFYVNKVDISLFISKYGFGFALGIVFSFQGRPFDRVVAHLENY